MSEPVKTRVSSPIGVWSNSDGFSLAPTNGDVVFRADGTGEMSICLGEEDEFSWATTDKGMFEMWEADNPEQRHLICLFLEKDRGWFALYNGDQNYNSEIVSTLTCQEWIRVRS